MNPLTQNLYGAWVFGPNGYPINLAAHRPVTDPSGVVHANYGHGTPRASGTPMPQAEFHGLSSQWSTQEGYDLSGVAAGAWNIERTEPLSLVWIGTPNVTRSGATTVYSILLNKEDDGTKFAGFNYHLVWDSVTSQEEQRLQMTSDNSTGNILYCKHAVDLTNNPAVLGFTYSGNSLASGVTFWWDSGPSAATAITDALSATIIPATPLPSIGCRTVAGAVNAPFKGNMSLLFFWRGRALSGGEMVEMDVNPQQVFLVPSYRRWSIPAAPIVGTPITRQRAGVYA